MAITAAQMQHQREDGTRYQRRGEIDNQRAGELLHKLRIASLGRAGKSGRGKIH